MFSTRIPIVPVYSSNCQDHKRTKLRKIGKSIHKLVDTLDDIGKKDFERTKELFTEKAGKDLSVIDDDRQTREVSFDMFD